MPIVRGILVPLLISVTVATALAGNLEPSAPPAPTMKSMEEIPGSWHRLLPANNGAADGCNSSRFKCVMSGQAVLDLETGLVWQREPNNSLVAWSSANYGCVRAVLTGSRLGWRLPTIGELASLIDVTSSSLPAGHPFVGVITTSGEFYWSRSSDPGQSNPVAFIVNFTPGISPDQHGFWQSKSLNARTWCVRGGQVDYESM